MSMQAATKRPKQRSVPTSGKYAASPDLAKRAPRDPLGQGEVLEGKYRIERMIGQGAMGVVFAATHLELDEVVAIKLIRRDMQEIPDIVARFAREAKASARIKSEHTAKVLDVGMTEATGPYIVMEYLDGRDLHDVLSDEGPLSIRRAVDYILQACEALAHAHAYGITHRDIKPENLFLARQGHLEIIKVLDFGISKAALTGSMFGGDLSSLHTSIVMGTPNYMSPEQLRGTSTIDHRTDIWSLGAVLYQLLCGHAPFASKSIAHVCTMILDGAPTPLREHASFASPELEAIIVRCLEKDPAARFQNVADFAASLLDFAPSRARVYVERATSILCSVGVQVTVDPRLSSMPPRSSGSLAVSIPSNPHVPVAWPHEKPAHSSATSSSPSTALSPDSLRDGAPLLPPVGGDQTESEGASAPRNRPLGAAPTASSQVARRLSRSGRHRELRFRDWLPLLAGGALCCVGIVVTMTDANTRPATAASALRAIDTTATRAVLPAPARPGLVRPALSLPAVSAASKVGRVVRIESDPSDALVEIADEAIGRTPLTTTLPLGPQQVQISKPGFSAETMPIDLEPARDATDKPLLILSVLGRARQR